MFKRAKAVATSCGTGRRDGAGLCRASVRGVRYDHLHRRQGEFVADAWTQVETELYTTGFGAADDTTFVQV